MAIAKYLALSRRNKAHVNQNDTGSVIRPGIDTSDAPSTSDAARS
jgi:hypothetical protein